MPILNIEIIREVREDIKPGLTSRLAEITGEVLQSRPQGTWVKLHYLPQENYSEKGGLEAGLPVIVSLIQANPPTGQDLEEQVSRLTESIARTVGHPPENIHILIEPPAVGRIAFGGTLRK